MKRRRGLTTPAIAAASGAAMMLLSTTVGTASKSQSELTAVHARAAADLAAWSALRALSQEVREAASAEVEAEGARLVLETGGARDAYYVLAGRLYRDSGDGSRSVVQNEVDSVSFERDGGFLILQVSSRQRAGAQTFVTTRGSEIRLPR